MTLHAIEPLPVEVSHQGSLARRVRALALRHIYLHMGSWPRIIEMMYWPLVNIASWGFVSIYLSRRFEHVEVMSQSIIAAVVLMEFFMRPTVMMLMLFMEEIWAHNLGHLFASPLNLAEYAFASGCVTLVRASIALVPLVIVAYFMLNF